MVAEVVDARERAGELAGARLVVVPYVGHHIVKLQDLTAFVLLSEACVEGDFGNVQRRAVATGPGTGGTGWAGPSWLSRGPSWAWRARDSRASSESLFPHAAG